MGGAKGTEKLILAEARRTLRMIRSPEVEDEFQSCVRLYGHRESLSSWCSHSPCPLAIFLEHCENRLSWCPTAGNSVENY